MKKSKEMIHNIQTTHRRIMFSQFATGFFGKSISLSWWREHVLKIKFDKSNY